MLKRNRSLLFVIFIVGSLSWRTEKEHTSAQLSKVGKILIPFEHRNDKDFVLGVLDEVGSACLEFASEEIRCDKEFIIGSGSSTEIYYNFKYSCDKLRKDREFVLRVVKSDGMALRFVSEELKNDREVVLTAVKSRGLAIKYASEELKKDREITMEAVKEKGDAVEFVSKIFRNDPEIVMIAIQDSFDIPNFRFASDELKSDRDFISKVVKLNTEALKYANEDFRDDREIVLSAIQENGGAIEFASERFKNDREIVTIAVKNRGSALRYVSKKFQNDPEIVYYAVKDEEKGSWWSSKDKNFEYASDELKEECSEFSKDKKLLPKCLKKLILFHSDQEEEFGEILIPRSKRDDREIVLKAVKKNGLALKYAKKELKSDDEVVLAAVKQNNKAMKFANEELRGSEKFQKNEYFGMKGFLESIDLGDRVTMFEDEGVSLDDLLNYSSMEEMRKDFSGILKVGELRRLWKALKDKKSMEVSK